MLDERVARKREICAQYVARLGNVPGITFMPEAPYGKANRWLTVILIDHASFACRCSMGTCFPCPVIVLSGLCDLCER